MNIFLKRMIGAARLDANTYEEVEADSTSTMSAILVVLIASVAAAFPDDGILPKKNPMTPSAFPSLVSGSLIHWTAQ